MPFFLHFRPDFLITPLPECIDAADAAPPPEPITAHDFLMQRLREINLARVYLPGLPASDPPPRRRAIRCANATGSHRNGETAAHFLRLNPRFPRERVNSAASFIKLPQNSRFSASEPA
jgi:hypothetical protein